MARKEGQDGQTDSRQMEIPLADRGPRPPKKPSVASRLNALEQLLLVVARATRGTHSTLNNATVLSLMSIVERKPGKWVTIPITEDADDS